MHYVLRFTHVTIFPITRQLNDTSEGAYAGYCCSFAGQCSTGVSHAGNVSFVQWYLHELWIPNSLKRRQSRELGIALWQWVVMPRCGLCLPQKGEAVDLDGRTVTPGFIDAHLHFLSYGSACVRSI